MTHWMRLLGCLGLAYGLHAGAAEVQVAVASNFSAPMQKIAAEFEKDTGHRALLSFGSTSKFYTQIHNGAPFQVLLAADADTPARLETEGRAVAGTRFTYAFGRLVLWSRNPTLVDATGEVLKTDRFSRIALADPRLAPYGAAALAALQGLGLWRRLQSRAVQGENIGQTFQFVSTGNAELGLVALSQIMLDGKVGTGSYWLVPGALYQPLRQDAILLHSRGDTQAAIALLGYLKSDKARNIMGGYGYTRN